MTDYDALLKICEARKSTRVFDSAPVHGDMIEKIRKIALTSPYASGRKNWEVKVITDRDLLRSMARVVEEKTRAIQERIRPDMQEHFASYARNFSFFASAPALFVTTFRAAPSLSLMLPEPGPDIIQWERDASVKSISCVAMLILLAAESLGLGGCYVTGALIAEEELARLLDIPKGRNIGALIPVGFPAKRINQEENT